MIMSALWGPIASPHSLTRPEMLEQITASVKGRCPTPPEWFYRPVAEAMVAKLSWCDFEWPSTAHTTANRVCLAWRRV